MFSPSELEEIPIRLQRIINELENDVMADIIRRISINDEITRSADYQIYRLNQIGANKKYIKDKIDKTLGLADGEIDRLYDEVIASGYARDKALYDAMGKDFIPFKENEQLQQLIKAVKQQTKGEFVNITRSAGFRVDINGRKVFTPLFEYYQKILDKSVMEIATGSFDYNTTIKRAVKEMINSSIRTVDYDSGWTNSIEVATRRALMTGITQVTNTINEMNAKALETDYFEVSWHATARPSHQKWQGRVYSLEELKTICGLGEITGLCGANCYHSYFPFIPGISVRTYTDKEIDQMNAKENEVKLYNGREYTSYDATQRQRELETLMRKRRKEIRLLKQGNASIEDIENVQAKYRETMRQYVDFSRKMGLPQQKERIYSDGLKRVG